MIALLAVQAFIWLPLVVVAAIGRVQHGSLRAWWLS